MAPAIGASVEQHLTLDATAIRAGASLIGDSNPLHHDAEFAATSRFGELIASGAHTAGLLAGMPSKGFDTDPGFYVGVDYNARFLAPVRVDRPLRLHWTVTAHEPKRSGTLVRMEGGITDLSDGVTVLAATMSILFLR